MRPGAWQRYVPPAAFLLVVTVAVIAVRAGLESGDRQKAARTPTTAAAPVTIVVHNRPTTTAQGRHRAPAKRYWTVRAGDTFGAISAATGVPLATIELLNPKVSSASLFIGERVRIR